MTLYKVQLDYNYRDYMHKLHLKLADMYTRN